jgi:hypothetical protein
MIDDERRTGRGVTGGVVLGLLLAGLVVLRLAGSRLGFDLPDVALPELHLPGWLRWIGPVLGIGKLLFLIGLGLLAVLGKWERRRRSGGDPR